MYKHMSNFYPANREVKIVSNAEIDVFEYAAGTVVARLKTRVIARCRNRDYCWATCVLSHFGRALTQPSTLVMLVHLPTGCRVRYLSLRQFNRRSSYFFTLSRKLVTFYKRILQTADPQIPTLKSAAPIKQETYHDGRGNIIEVTSQ